MVGARPEVEQDLAAPGLDQVAGTHTLERRRWRAGAEETDAHYCGSMPSSLASLPNCSISLRITLVNSSGVLPTGCRPALTRRSLTSGSLSAFTVSSCSLPMISRGVPRGARRPSHCDDSKPGYPAS